MPSAPSEVSTLFDLVVGASNICASSWLEGAGAIYAENQALRWIADIAGFPQGAGGVFVSGGTAGNLSALVAARHDWRQAHPECSNQRGLIISSRGAHASVAQAAQVMDADLVQSGGHQLTGMTWQQPLPSSAGRPSAAVCCGVHRRHHQSGHHR
ncbi:MAG: hypothetical protein CM15mP74_24390 [Halieaceae bacterium]|nr:MAG: hypothetical protein CM15mP74_24390 [Halieaceae bacterium]